MNLSDIKLPSSVIQELYKKNLVENGLPPLPGQVMATILSPEPAKKDSPKSHSSVAKPANVLVIVNNKGPIDIPEEELTLLTNMLSACKLSLNDIRIINLDQPPRPTYKELIPELLNGTVLLFGTAPSSLELPVDFPFFQVQSFNGCTFLYSPSLQEIKYDKALKTRLWTCLRKIFNL